MLILNIDVTKLQTQNITSSVSQTVSQKTFLVENYFKTKSINEV